MVVRIDSDVVRIQSHYSPKQHVVHKRAAQRLSKMRMSARVLNGFVDGSQEAVRSLLKTAGEIPNREGLLDTPRVRHLLEIFANVPLCSA